MSSSNEPPGGPAGPRQAAAADHRPEGDRGRERAGGAARKPSRARRRPHAIRVRPWRQRPALAWLPPDVPWPLVGGRRRRRGRSMLAVLALARRVLRPRRAARRRVDARLARVEQQMRDLAARPLPVAGDAKAVDDLAGRLARLETVGRDAAAADHRSGAGEPHRDARRRAQGAGRARRRARPPQRRDRRRSRARRARAPMRPRRRSPS